MNTIICKSCGVENDIDKAIESQIESRIIAAAKHEHEAEIAKVRKQATDLANEQLRNRLELEAEKSKQVLEHERERLSWKYRARAKGRYSVKNS